MKNIILSIFFILNITLVNGQVKEGLYAGIGGVYAQNNISGSFELGKPLEPVGDKGIFSIGDSGFGVKGLVGYGKMLNKFYLGGEFSIDRIYSQKGFESNGNWNFRINNGMGFDIAILFGVLAGQKCLIYVKTGFVPYSRFNIAATHSQHGTWEDHNFIGFNFGTGSRINIGVLDLKIEIKNNSHVFSQPLKDGAISSQRVRQWDVEIGIVMN